MTSMPENTEVQIIEEFRRII